MTTEHKKHAHTFPKSVSKSAAIVKARMDIWSMQQEKMNGMYCIVNLMPDNETIPFLRQPSRPASPVNDASIVKQDELSESETSDGSESDSDQQKPNRNKDSESDDEHTQDLKKPAKKGKKKKAKIVKPPPEPPAQIFVVTKTGGIFGTKPALGSAVENETQTNLQSGTSGASVSRWTLLSSDEFISRQHFCIHFQFGRFWLMDMDSTNSTFLQRVTDSTFPPQFPVLTSIGSSGSASNSNDKAEKVIGRRLTPSLILVLGSTEIFVKEVRDAGAALQSSNPGNDHDFSQWHSHAPPVEGIPATEVAPVVDSSGREAKFDEEVEGQEGYRLVLQYYTRPSSSAPVSPVSMASDRSTLELPDMRSPPSTPMTRSTSTASASSESSRSTSSASMMTAGHSPVSHSSASHLSSTTSATPYLSAPANNAAALKTVEIGSRGATIGREDSNCDVRLPDGDVESLHASIFLHRGQFYIQDLSRSHQFWTRLRGNKSGSLAIGDRDIIRAGRSQYKVNIRAAPPELREAHPATCASDIGATFDGNFEFNSEMQDRLVVIDGFGGNPRNGFFAVMDGHQERRIADFASSALHQNLLEEIDQSLTLLRESRRLARAVHSVPVRAAPPLPPRPGSTSRGKPTSIQQPIPLPVHPTIVQPSTVMVGDIALPRDLVQSIMEPITTADTSASTPPTPLILINNDDVLHAPATKAHLSHPVSHSRSKSESSLPVVDAVDSAALLTIDHNQPIVEHVQLPSLPTVSTPSLASTILLPLPKSDEEIEGVMRARFSIESLDPQPEGQPHSLKKDDLLASVEVDDCPPLANAPSTQQLSLPSSPISSSMAQLPPRLAFASKPPPHPHAPLEHKQSDNVPRVAEPTQPRPTHGPMGPRIETLTRIFENVLSHVTASHEDHTRGGKVTSVRESDPPPANITDDHDCTELLPLVDIKLCLQKAFRRTAQQIVGMGETSKYAGSTAVSCVLWQQRDQSMKLFTANIGDSRAIILRGSQATMLSYDHKASDEAERNRVMQAGGKIGANNRLAGLEVTRSFGDRALSSMGLSAEPFISEISLAAEDSFLVLSSDGVFDVMENSDALNYLSKQYSDDKLSAHRLSESLVSHAMERDSQDNLAVVVVRLH